MSRQIKLNLGRVGRAERRAHISDRLHGYEFRQAAREAKRRRAARKRNERALRLREGMVESDPQLLIPGLDEEGQA